MSEIIIRDWQPSDAQRSDRSAGDRTRHRRKVRQAIRKNIGDIIAEESLIGRSNGHIVKVPIRGIKEYRFVYGRNVPGVAQGRGGSEPGEVLERSGPSEDPAQAGDRRGVDYYETEITLEELIEIMFEDLELPLQERKNFRQIETEGKRKYSGYRRKDIRARLSLHRTAVERVRRLQATKLSLSALENQVKQLEDSAAAQTASDPEKSAGDLLLAARKGRRLKELRDLVGVRQARRSPNPDGPKGGRFPFRNDDMRFRHRRETPRRESNAVVLCVMDSSGSMDTVKKYLARSFFFLLHRFVSTRYSKVEVVFIAHDTEAREVTEEEFFHKGESGGTMISSGYNKALEIIQERYHPSLWNVYGFHCSDGDNFGSDNDAALEAAKKLCEVCKLFGYGEIKPGGFPMHGDSMRELFSKGIDADNYQSILIEKKEDIWPGFKELLRRERAEP